MKNLMTFLGLAAKGGLLILLPLLLFVLLITEIFELVQGIAAPIAGLFPIDTFEDPQHPVLLSLFLIAGLSLLLGIAMKASPVQRLGHWLETNTIGKLPIYNFVKTIVSGLVGGKETAAFKPALFSGDNGLQEFVYVVETLADGRLTVLFPMAPTGFSGPVKIIPKKSVSPLNASLGDVNLVLNHMGLGAGQLLDKEHQSAAFSDTHCERD